MSEKFDPKSKVTKMQGKDYLEVKWRIVWFRADHPKGSILTEVLNDDLMKATIIDGDGKVLATGHGSAKKQGVAKSRPFEGAETAAIGRALAHAGYGTQFTDELEEGDHLADSPVEHSNGNGQGDKKTAGIAWTVAQKQALLDAKLAENDYAAKGMLGLSDLPVDASPEMIVKWGKLYKTTRTSTDPETGRNYTANLAAQIANRLMKEQVN